MISVATRQPKPKAKAGTCSRCGQYRWKEGGIRSGGTYPAGKPRRTFICRQCVTRMCGGIAMQQPQTFQVNAFYERLISLRSTNRKAFESMSPNVKTALVQYEAAKRQAEQDREASGADIAA